MAQHGHPWQHSKTIVKSSNVKRQVQYIFVKNFWFLRKSIALALILEKHSQIYLVESFENRTLYFATC